MREQSTVSGAVTDYPRDRTVAQHVEGWAARTPNAIAVVDHHEVLCYADLNRRANRVAFALREQGVGPNVRVATCLERSVDLVVALLGILKAGGAYVPLDPHSSADRLTYLLQDSDAAVVIATAAEGPRLQVRAPKVLSMAIDAASIGRQRDQNPPGPAALTDLIYVVYTSGSTGKPKGVMVAHDSVLNMLVWHQHAFGLSETDRTTCLSSPAFDATGWEVWPTLTAGAALHIVEESVRADAVALRAFLIEQAITVSFAPTALAEQLIALPWPSTAPLRYLLTGADALRRYPPAGLPFVLVNNYGPTEATVLVTSGIVPPVAHPTQAPGLGRPIANTQIHLLDEHAQPVPAGEVGEVHIGGKPLAVGYLNLPELTARQFIANPFSDEPGARLYKTGDLARQLPDGQLGFVGRVDHQIKIRGYRIEPGEIVSALRGQPEIEMSYVMAREDVALDKRLVAYLVFKAGVSLDVNQLREALRETLPDYMVPAAFVPMGTLPYTSNGKVDRDALPVPNTENTLQERVVTGPTTPIERELTAIVTTLLQVGDIDVDDNFFMLGGHSLLGTQVISRVAETFAIALPLRALFEAPSIRELAACVEQRLRDKIAAMSEDEAKSLL